jgi:hypothetical protein
MKERRTSCDTFCPVLKRTWPTLKKRRDADVDDVGNVRRHRLVETGTSDETTGVNVKNIKMFSSKNGDFDLCKVLQKIIITLVCE